MTADDDHDSPGRDRRKRCTAAVEDHDVGLHVDRDACARFDVGRRDATGEASSAPPTPDSRDTHERRGLEMVGRCMTTRARQLDERIHGWRNSDDLGFCRPAPPHRDDHDPTLGSKKTRQVARDRRLADALPRSDDGDRRELERPTCGRVETKVGTDVRHAACEHATGEGEARDRPEHGLVGEVDDDVRGVLCDRGLDIADERHAVLLSPTQLLLATNEHRRDEVVGKLGERITNDRGVMLAVDDGESSQVRAVTSSSIAPVNFAYSSVSSANETSLTWPWNGCRRQMSTRLPSISMML